VPEAPQTASVNTGETAAYDIRVDGKQFHVEVAPSGTLTRVEPLPTAVTPVSEPVAAGQTITAPLAGNIVRVLVSAGASVNEGDVVMMLEAMKMETEVRSTHSGTVSHVHVSEGDAVQSGQALIEL
jgi:oxaloacetate decarboxylase alpha subunit